MIIIIIWLWIVLFCLSFDIVNIFPSIDNISGLEAVLEILSNRKSDFPPAECILEVLTICLERNNAAFENVVYLQKNSTAIWYSHGPSHVMFP